MFRSPFVVVSVLAAGVIRRSFSVLFTPAVAAEGLTPLLLLLLLYVVALLLFAVRKLELAVVTVRIVILPLPRTFLSGLRRTTRSLGRKRHERITVALKLRHMASVVS